MPCLPPYSAEHSAVSRPDSKGLRMKFARRLAVSRRMRDDRPCVRPVGLRVPIRTVRSLTCGVFGEWWQAR